MVVYLVGILEGSRPDQLAVRKSIDLADFFFDTHVRAPIYLQAWPDERGQ